MEQPLPHHTTDHTTADITWDTPILQMIRDGHTEKAWQTLQSKLEYALITATRQTKRRHHIRRKTPMADHPPTA